MRFSQFLAEKEEDQYILMVDMDGVLTDFDGQFRKQFNVGDPTKYEDKHGPKEFWKLVHSAGKEYWSRMPWKNDGKKLWSYIKKYNPTILSTPSSAQFSKDGKNEWIKRELKVFDRDRIILSHGKEKYVKGPNYILIDDRPKNINKWKGAGGVGIVHTNAFKTIKQLKGLGL
jgi:hypothetical protein